MTRFGISPSFGAGALGLFLAAAPAQALNFVSYVSVFTGSSSGDCYTPATACQSINQALAKTEPGGEIKCLDTHQDGSNQGGEVRVQIDRPITIDCGAPTNLIVGYYDVAAITINLNEATYPNGVVRLRNMNINGFLWFGIRPGTAGIRVIGGGAVVHVENCTINGFVQQGIDFEPSSTVELFVRDTTIGEITGAAILVKPTGASNAKVVLDNVNVEDSSQGINIEGSATSGTISATVRDSFMSHNTAFGIKALESGAGSTNLMLESSTSNNNGTNGVIAVGSNAVIRMRNSTSTGNGASGVVVSGGGQLISHGGNVVAGNTTNGSFTGSFAQQ